LTFYGLALVLLTVAVGLARRETTGATATVVAPEARATPITANDVPLTVADLRLPTADGAITRWAEVRTLIPSRPRYDVTKYTVVKNDTIFIIASNFNLEPETILWGNPKLADNPNILSVGMELNILPINGALRVVQPGDTVEKIAKAFHGTVEDILNFPGNNLDPTEADPPLKAGQNIIIPGGWRDSVVWQLPSVTRSTSGRISGEPGSCAGPFSGPSGTFSFVWPANNHFLSGTDYLPVGHPGLDIAAGLGAPIYASDTGVIVFAGWSTRGYGNLIIVDHGNGWQTAYAHLSQINVVCGQGVFQGNLIGLSGSTGNSTGAHLHFEMRSDTYGRVNPWLYLP
jgi:LysM repeat protein